MNTSRLILRKLREEHVGRDKSIKRKDLLTWLWEGVMIDKLTESADREMRAIIETMPVICSCESGYYIAEDYEGVKYALDYISKKAMPLLVKMRRKKEAYPEYFKGNQGDLPYENEEKD